MNPQMQAQMNMLNAYVLCLPANGHWQASATAQYTPPMYLMSVPPMQQGAMQPAGMSMQQGTLPIAASASQVTAPPSRTSPTPPPSQLRSRASTPTPCEAKQPGVYVTKKSACEFIKDEKNKPSFVHNPYAFPSQDESDSCDDTDGGGSLDNSNLTTDSEGGRKKRRRKKLAKVLDDNKACDALRYKTKMCKNWEITSKCPYGPRCLFAHGKKELRSYTENNQAIVNAARTTSPEKNFFIVGRFPSFIPIPYELLQMSREILPVEAAVTERAPDIPERSQPAELPRKIETMTA